MNIDELHKLFRTSGKRTETVSNGAFSAVVAPDLEGRIYFVKNGIVLSRVNPDAIRGHSTRAGYLNPGGDGLWAAPEGTKFGYQYGTGSWRVPCGLVNSRFEITEKSSALLSMEAEVDLVNSKQLALPCLFRRKIEVTEDSIRQTDSIRYLGAKTLNHNEFLLAPWSLAQFDAGPASFGRFPSGSVLRDLYTDTSAGRMKNADGSTDVRNSRTERWQIAVGAEASAVELFLPEKELRVFRRAELPVFRREYIDIADAAPDVEPVSCGVRYSIYSDPSGFMEIEAAGGCAFPLVPETELDLRMETFFAEYIHDLSNGNLHHS